MTGRIMKRRGIIFTVLMCALPLFAFSASDVYAGTFRLRVDHGHAETHVTHVALSQWADKVRERTNGAVDITVYTNFQLGTPDDLLEQIRQGSNVGYHSDPARLATFVKDIGVLNGPYVLSTYDQVLKLAESDLTKGWEDRLRAEHNIEVLSWNYGQGFRSVFSNKLAKNPTEFRGILIRVAESPVWNELGKSLGAVPVPVAYGETYSAIQTHIVDGCEQNIGSVYASKIYEVTKYFIETKHCFLSNTLVVSHEWFAKLPAEFQRILKEESHAAGIWYANKLAEDEAGYIKTMIDYGIIYIPFADLDIDAFHANAKEFFKVQDLENALRQVQEVLAAN